MDRGIPAHVDTPVRELVVEDGAVVGVRAEQDGRPFCVRARRGVVLGVGGYDMNRALARQFEAMPDWNSACPPHLDGDHLVMAGEIGAAIGAVPPTNLAMFYGYNIPGEEHEGKPLYRSSWECGCPHAIWVNRAGERFCDESFYKDYQPRLRHWDGQKQTHAEPAAVPDLRSELPRSLSARLLHAGPGRCPRSWSCRRTRRARWRRSSASIPSASSRRSSASTASRRDGEDPDFGKGSRPWAVRLVGDPHYPNPCVGPLDKPPFYGVRLVPVSVWRQLARARDRHERAGAAPARPRDPGPLRGRQLRGAARSRRRLPERHARTCARSSGATSPADTPPGRSEVAEAEYTTTAKLPVDRIWDFVAEMDNWARFVTGYQSHEKRSETESPWTLKGDVGVLSRKLVFKVDITEWSPGKRAAFRLKGVNEPMEGEGVFTLEAGCGRRGARCARRRSAARSCASSKRSCAGCCG